MPLSYNTTNRMDMSDYSQVAGVVLAGGAASRYGGVPKGLLEIAPGVSMISRLIDEMADSGIVALAISANQPDLYGRFGVPVIPDLRQNLGPLAGIEAALTHFRQSHQAVLFVPCDLPSISSREVSRLIKAFAERGRGVVYAETGGFFDHPLCAVVHNDLLHRITGLIDQGLGRVTDAWRELGAEAVTFDDLAPFANVNSADDMARWRQQMTKSRVKISVPQALAQQVRQFVESEAVPVAVTGDSDADVRVIVAEGRVESDLKTLQSGGWIACATARALARKLRVQPRQAGRLLDLLDIRIRDCELGCF